MGETLKKSKKVAFIVPILTEYRLYFFERLHQELLKVGIELMVFHGAKNLNDGRPAYSGHIGFPNTIYEFSERYFLGLKFVMSNSYSKVFACQPNLIITQGAVGVLHNWVFSFFFRSSSRKLFYWTCGWDTTVGSIKKQLKKLLASFLFKRADCHICYSEKAWRYVRDLGYSGKGAVAYNGIDLNFYKNSRRQIFESRESIRSSQGSGSSDFIYLYVGGVSKNKKMYLLLDAFCELSMPNSKLWIIGDGPELKKLMKDYSGNSDILFMGRITDGVDYYFHAADCLVLPGEGGLALNQALLWDTPCIVSEADGTELDLIENEKNGLFFEKSNQMSLVEKMQKIRALELGQTSDKILNLSNTDEMVRTFMAQIQSEIR